MNFKEWLILIENIQGEYWIMDGQAMGADDDFTHESYAIMTAQNEIVENAVSNDFVDWRKYQNNDFGVDWNQFTKDLIEGYKKENPQEAEAYEDHDDEEWLQWAFKELEVDDELLSIANDHGDVRNLAMKRWGWKAMRGNYIQTWTLTSEDLRSISSGIHGVIHDEKDFEVELEVVSTKKVFDVPISVIETGDPMKVINWGKQQSMPNSMNAAYDKTINNLYPPTNPYYKRYGD